MLKTIKEIKKEVKLDDIRVDKLFALNNKKNVYVGKSIILGAYLVKKAISVKNSIDLLDVPMFAKVYQDFKDIEKSITVKSKDIKLAMIRKELINTEYYQTSEIAAGYLNLLCNGKELQDFKLYKNTLLQAICTIEKDCLTIKIVQTEYAENGLIKSTLVLDTVKTDRLAFEITDFKEKFRDIVIDLELSLKSFKTTKGLRQAIKDLPSELEKLPTKIKADLVDFINNQTKTDVSIDDDYLDILG